MVNFGHSPNLSVEEVVITQAFYLDLFFLSSEIKSSKVLVGLLRCPFQRVFSCGNSAPFLLNFPRGYSFSIPGFPTVLLVLALGVGPLVFNPFFSPGLGALPFGRVRSGLRITFDFGHFRVPPRKGALHWSPLVPFLVNLLPRVCYLRGGDTPSPLVWVAPGLRFSLLAVGFC